jgi:hypothetical protein
VKEVTANRALLVEGLRFAVPLHIAEMRNWEPARRRLHGLPAGWRGNIHRADSLMFRPKSPSGWNSFRLAFGTWARGLAVLAYEPDGVDALGLHFCAASHDGCPRDWVPREGCVVRWAPRKRLDVAAVMAEFHRILDAYEALLTVSGGVHE